MSSSNAKEQLNKYIEIYLANARKRGFNNDELEVRFGMNAHNPITRIDFENVIEKVKSSGFLQINSMQGEYHLNIQNEYNDMSTGRTKISNIRTEICDLHNIQDYCRTNSFNFENPPDHIGFQSKNLKHVNGNKLFPIDFHEFEFRVNYKEEKILKSNYTPIQSLLAQWRDSRKIYRLIKRFSFTHPDYPFRIDFSIVKSSKKIRKNYIREYTIENSNVFNNPENYEIEIELMNKKMQNYESDLLASKLRKCIQLVLSGLQQTNYPISNPEKDSILDQYINILYKGKSLPERRIVSKDFIGPSSISLEIENIVPINEEVELSVPNINDPYTVTEKADGMRKLLFISNKGKIYLIDTNMNIQFTGCITKEKNIFLTIIDGEHVLHNKKGEFINLYLAFDIYYLKGEDLRMYPFAPMENLEYTESNIDKSKFRFPILHNIIPTIDSRSFT